MPNTSTNEVSAIWEKVRIISILIASVLIPVIAVVIGNSYTKAIKENELGLRYVELAINILTKAPDSDNKSVEMRKWAIEVVNYYSEVPLSHSAISELNENKLHIIRANSREREREVILNNIEDNSEYLKEMKPIKAIR